MNIILFESDEIERPLPMDDERARHLLEVLGRKVGDSFDAGIVNGPKGKGTLKSIENDKLTLEFEWLGEEPSLFPIDLIVGLSRPQTNRKILQEATSLGVRSIHFITTDRGEPSYATSRLWTTGEWRRHLVAGTAQAFTTRIPDISFGKSLFETVEKLDTNSARIALDNYEATGPLVDKLGDNNSFTICVGSERGWTGDERDMLLQNGFRLAHLGERPLRTETAVVAAVSIVLSQQSWK